MHTVVIILKIWSEINTFDVKFQYGEITSILYGASIFDVIIFIF